jgi:glutamate synthase (NADPH/NADH) large chain
MSGGIAYVFDEDGMFARRCNLAMVSLEKVLPATDQLDDGTRHRNSADETLLRALIEQHHAATGSEQAQRILASWAQCRGQFVKVFPHEYRRALKEMATATSKQKEAA